MVTDFSDTVGLKLAAGETGSGGDIIGDWLTDRPYVKSLMVIRKLALALSSLGLSPMMR